MRAVNDKATQALITLISLAILAGFIYAAMAQVYGFVRFVKWAWEN
jgi:archaellum component FlaF (FlaF/FlaG flagellin family)